MMKFSFTTLFTTAAALLLAGNSIASGIATSAQPFDLLRAGSQTGAESSSVASAVVNPGDAFSTPGSTLQIEFPGGNSMLVDQGSRASLAGPNSLELHEGALIAGKRGEEPFSVKHQDLNIESIGNADADSTLYVGTLESGNVIVASLGGAFAVTQIGTDQGIVALGGGDAAELQQTPSGWQTVGGGVEPLPAELPVVERGALNTDREAGIILFWMTPAGIGTAGALAGGGALAYYLLRDDDDDDSSRRRRRPPVSPVTVNDIQ